jgi:uncharacterized protein (DUF697 family)
MSTKSAEADAIIKAWMWWAAGAGLIPVPVVDLAAVTGVQLKMLRDLSDLYGVEFSQNRGKSILGALLGGLVAKSAAVGPLGAIIKAIPVFGPVVGVVTMPGFYAGSTFAVGRVFAQHFELGGTFLNFDASAAQAQLVEEYEKAKTKPKS